MRPLVSALETLVGEELLLPVNLASRLVLSSTAFAQQFVQVWGEERKHGRCVWGGGEELLLPVNLASRLVLSSTAFAQQFVQVCGGKMWGG